MAENNQNWNQQEYAEPSALHTHNRHDSVLHTLLSSIECRGQSRAPSALAANHSHNGFGIVSACIQVLAAHHPLVTGRFTGIFQSAPHQVNQRVVPMQTNGQHHQKFINQIPPQPVCQLMPEHQPQFWQVQCLIRKQNSRPYQTGQHWRICCRTNIERRCPF